MYRLRLQFLLVLMVAVAGTCAARAQDGTSDLDNQLGNKYHNMEPEKPKPGHTQDKPKANDNGGHRKHWWSLPHFWHRKHDKDASARQPEPSTSSKTVAAKPMNKTVAPKRQSSKTVAAARPGHKSVAANGHGSKAVAANKPRRKTAAAASHAGKPAQRHCSAEETKKGGCRAAQKQHSLRAATGRS